MYYNGSTSPQVLWDSTTNGPDAGKTFKGVAASVGSGSVPVTFTVLDGNGVPMTNNGREGVLLAGGSVGFHAGVRGISKITATFTGAAEIAACPHDAA